ncbi:MAG: CvpA family protein [Candidatus Omnitrophota bacterium]
MIYFLSIKGVSLSTFIQNLNWLDIVFVILLLGMIYKGVHTGVGGQILSLAGWFLILFTTLAYYNIISKAVFGFLLQTWSRPVSFLSIAVFVFICMKVVERVANVKPGEESASIEKIAGILVASLRAILLFGLIGMLLLLTPIKYTRNTVLTKSKTAMFFINTDAKIYSLITGYFGLSKKRTKNEVMEDLLFSQ